jgi:phospholipid-binding lipoprotein MlaA
MRSALLLVLALLGLGGCASRDFSIRSLPPETPAADNAAAAKAFAMLAAAQTQIPRQAIAPEGAIAVTPLTTADAPSMYSYDPWECVNRFTYRFNARFDEAVFLPVANGYRRVPAPLRAGVHNFFENLSEVDSIVNYAAQLRLSGSARSLGRFVINSTLGIGGLFDVASKFKLESSPTGFGATLSTWGMHPGPYVVIPILGPSTLRDGIGLLGDFGIEYAVDVVQLYRGNKTWLLGVADSIDKRATSSFRYYSTGSPFEYETVRFLYVHKELIEDGALRTKVRPKEGDGGAPAGK